MPRRRERARAQRRGRGEEPAETHGAERRRRAGRDAVARSRQRRVDQESAERSDDEPAAYPGEPARAIIRSRRWRRGRPSHTHTRASRSVLDAGALAPILTGGAVGKSRAAGFDERFSKFRTDAGPRAGKSDRRGAAALRVASRAALDDDRAAAGRADAYRNVEAARRGAA